MSVLSDVYGELLIVRPPVPATTNKAGANYKSEVTHLDYSPRRAYDEWLQILDGIVACGGDALYQFEAADDPYLDHAALDVDGDGAIHPAGSKETLGNLADVMTGRVFAANGPWVAMREGVPRAVMPNMLAHRRAEADYYRALLGELEGEPGGGGESAEHVAVVHRLDAAVLEHVRHDRAQRAAGHADPRAVGSEHAAGHHVGHLGQRLARAARTYRAVAVDLEPGVIEERFVRGLELIDRIAAARDDRVEDRQPLVVGAARRVLEVRDLALVVRARLVDRRRHGWADDQ